MNLSDLSEGMKYRIRYQLPEQRRPREMVAKLLDVQPAPLSQSGKPEMVLLLSFGTAFLNLDHVLGIWTTDQRQQCYEGRIFDDGDRLL